MKTHITGRRDEAPVPAGDAHQSNSSTIHHSRYALGSVEMLQAYHDLPCAVRRFRAHDGITIAQGFEAMRVLINPPQPAYVFFMLLHGPQPDHDDDDQRSCFIAVSVFATIAALANTIENINGTVALTTFVDMSSAVMWLGLVRDIPRSFVPAGWADVVSDGDSAESTGGHSSGEPAPATPRRPEPTTSHSGSHTTEQNGSRVRSASTTAQPPTSPRAGFNDEDDVPWSRAPRGDAVAHYRGPPRDPFSRRYWGDGRGIPLRVDADAPRPYGVLLAAACHSYGGGRLVSLLTNNAAERQWQSLPSVDTILHGGAAKPRFAYQHHPWAPVAEPTLVAALRERLLRQSKQRHQQDRGPPEHLVFRSQGRIAMKRGPTATNPSSEQAHGSAPPSAISFDVDAAALQRVLSIVLTTIASAEAAFPPTSTPLAAPADSTPLVAPPTSRGGQAKRYCAAVDFIPSVSAGRGGGGRGGETARPAAYRRHRCFLCVPSYAGVCTPCRGECVVAVVPDPGASARAAPHSPPPELVGVVQTVSGWSRNKIPGGKHLTAVRRAATVEDVAALMALMPVPHDVTRHAVVAASGDDVRHPYVTGRMWSGRCHADHHAALHPDSPFHPSHGPAVFVELSDEVPTGDADSRAQCLEHVRRAVVRLPAQLGHAPFRDDRLFFVASFSSLRRGGFGGHSVDTS